MTNVRKVTGHGLNSQVGFRNKNLIYNLILVAAILNLLHLTDQLNIEVDKTALLETQLEQQMVVAQQSHKIELKNARTNEKQIVDRLSTQDIIVAINAKFGQNSPMLEIARCESSLRQFDKFGNPIRGTVNNQDVGVFMINEHYWLSRSIELGYNIYSLKGNIDMASYVLSQQGYSAWAWSKPCHQVS